MAEGTRFKTGFVGAPVSFGEMGRQISEDITNTAQLIQNDRRVRQNQLNQTMGFTKALEESVPAGVGEKYRVGAQTLLDRYQEAATKAYQSGNPDDIARYQQLKGEFIQFKNISSAKSALDGQTRLGIANGTIKNLSGSTEETLADFEQYNTADYRWNEATGMLEVSVNGQYVDWKTSNIADMNDVYVPQMKWQGTEYVPETVGQDIYETLLSQKQETYQVRKLGYATGEVDEAAIFSDINDEINNRLTTRGPELLEAMQAWGYKNIRVPGKTELTERDFAEAQAFYTEAELFDTEYPTGVNAGKSLTSGNINEEGKWVFDVTDEELNRVGMPEMIQKRKAVSGWAEATARRARQLIVVSDETAQLRKQILSEIPDPEEPPMEYTPIDSFMEPIITQVGDKIGPTKDPYPKVKASVPGRSYRFNISGNALPKPTDANGKPIEDQMVTQLTSGDIKVEVKNLIHDPSTGKLIGFDLNTGPGILDQAILGIEGTPIMNFTVMQESNPEVFKEVLTTINQVAPPSKSKRGGAQFLIDAEDAMIKMHSNAPTDEAIELASAYAQAMAGAVALNEIDAAEVMDWVDSLRPGDQTAAKTRILAEAENGRYPYIGNGQLMFQDSTAYGN